jgi:hypothetical protein
MKTRNLAPPAALLIGIGYLAGGLLGFIVTGFGGFESTRGHSILGFGLNPYHNLVHIVIGLGFIAAARAPSPEITQGVMIGGGAIYLVAAGVGFFYKLPILAIDTHLAPDNFLHLFSAVAAIAFALIGVQQQSRSENQTVAKRNGAPYALR